MRVKICGITRVEDAVCAENEGADAIGVVLFSRSPRSVTPEKAQEIFGAVGPFTATVAVTHTASEEDLRQILDLHPTAIQISPPFMFPQNPGVRVIRAIGGDMNIPADCDAIIVDESHGGGKKYDLSRVREVAAQSKIPIILAGGLNPENVAEAIRLTRPYAVDVATGVEISPGIKDKEKIKAFVAAAKRA